MSFKPKKKILVISLSVILVIVFSLVYVNFFIPKSSTPTSKIKSNKLLKQKKNSPTVNSSTENLKTDENKNKTVNYKPIKPNISPKSSPSNSTKAVSPKPVPKPSIPEISDRSIKTLLYNGDMAVRNFYSSAYFKNSNTKTPINLDNKTCSEMIPDINSYNALQNFMRKNYNLNSYYTESFIRKFMDESFRYVNGKYYILVGNYGLMIHYDNTFKVVSRTYSRNLLYLKISSYSDGDTSPYTSNITLYYSGNSWLIYRFDDWGIPSLAN